MASIFGDVTQSGFYYPMYNVTMSFMTSSTDVIVYTAYTDVNGSFTQSVFDGFSGKLVPTASAATSSYQFFKSPNNYSASFTNLTSDLTQSWAAVKNYTSGSGIFVNPYLILDGEDLHNMRFRTGSTISAIHYKLGANIDLSSSFAHWITINETGLVSWNGVLTGDNYTISNLNMTQSVGGGYFGLLGIVATPTSGSYLAFSDIIFNSCSITVTDTADSTYYMGIFMARNNSNVTFKNIHIKNSQVTYAKSSGGNNNYYIGGMVGGGTGDPTVYSCSVESSQVSLNLTTLTSNQPYVAGMTGLPGTGPYINCYVKDTSIYSNRNNLYSFFGLIVGTNGLFQNCYILSCSMNGTGASVSPFAYGPFGNSDGGGSTTNNYVALINYGSSIPQEARRPFFGDNSDAEGYNYYLSGSYLIGSGSAGAGITASVESDMQNSASYINWDFENVWQINPSVNYGYPYLYNEEFPITTYTSGLMLYYDSRKGYIGGTLNDFYWSGSGGIPNDKGVAADDSAFNAITVINIDKNDKNGVDVSNWLSTINSTEHIRLQNKDASRYALYLINTDGTDEGDYYSYSVTYVTAYPEESGIFDDQEDVSVHLVEGLWTDLTTSGSNASASYAYITGSNLYFGTNYGQSTASFYSINVSESFGVEIWTAPTTQSGKLVMFSTISGTFPRMETYITGSEAHLLYQGSASGQINYISSSNNISRDKFNHIAFYVSGNTGHIWSNGILYSSASVDTGSWTGGTIGILDTVNTNPYYGYIDVFKVWNGIAINTSESETYHTNRNYFNILPTVKYPV